MFFSLVLYLLKKFCFLFVGWREGGREKGSKEKGERKGKDREASESKRDQKERRMEEMKKSIHFDLKQFPGSFTVTGSDDWRVDLNEPSALEELVHGHCNRVSNTQDSREEAGLGSEVGVLPDVVQPMNDTTLEWVLLTGRGEGSERGKREREKRHLQFQTSNN